MRSLADTPACAATLVAIASFLAAPAGAQDHGRSGPYLGAGVLGGSYTQAEDDLDDALSLFGLQGADVDDATVGFEVYGGYRIVPNFALELEFEMLPDTDISAFGTASDLLTLDATGNGKVFLLTDRIQPYLLAGVGFMHAELETEGPFGTSGTESDTDFTARFGGGVDLYLTENVVLSVGADYLLPTGDLDGLDYVSYGGGLQYRF